jgi:anti-anti-sigma factor
VTGSDPPTPEPSYTVVPITGRLDATTVAEHRELLHRAVDTTAGVLVVDLSAVVALDATGLGMLLGTAHRAARIGRPVVLRGTPVRLARLLHATGMDRMLHVEPP